MNIFKLALINLFFLCPVAAKAQDKSVNDVPIISLSSMVMFALDKNPDVLMAEEREKQMGHYVKEARADFFPKVEMKVEGGREYLSPSTGTDLNNFGSTSLVLHQTIFKGFKNREEVRRRNLLEDSSNLDVRVQTETVISDTVKYYLSILEYQDEVKITEQFVKNINAIVDTIKSLYEEGAANKAMYDYAVSRRAAALTKLNEVKSSLNDSVSNLEFLTGQLPAFQAEPPDAFQAESFDLDFYVDYAKEENSQLRKNEAEQEAMFHQYKAEKADFFPTLSFQVEAEEKHNDGGEVGRSRDMKAKFSVNYKIFDGFKRQNAVSRVKSQAKELDIKNDKIYRELKREVKLHYNQIISLQEGIKATRLEIDAGENLMKLNQENFHLGTINVIELIEGEERLHSARMRLHSQYHDLYSNMYSLLIMSGILRQNYFCATCGSVD